MDYGHLLAHSWCVDETLTLLKECMSSFQSSELSFMCTDTSIVGMRLLSFEYCSSLRKEDETRHATRRLFPLLLFPGEH